MMTVDRRIYAGPCVGGPWKERWLESRGDPVYRLARMKEVKVDALNYYGDYWQEFGCGEYRWDVGIWWWRGWE
jgi:hypothetical protein